MHNSWLRSPLYYLYLVCCHVKPSKEQMPPICFPISPQMSQFERLKLPGNARKITKEMVSPIMPRCRGHGWGEGERCLHKLPCPFESPALKPVILQP